MREAISMPYLVCDHPLAVHRPCAQPLQGAVVDVDTVAEVPGGVLFPVVVTGLVTRPANAVNRHVGRVRAIRRRNGGHSRGRK